MYKIFKRLKHIFQNKQKLNNLNIYSYDHYIIFIPKFSLIFYLGKYIKYENEKLIFENHSIYTENFESYDIDFSYEETSFDEYKLYGSNKNIRDNINDIIILLKDITISFDKYKNDNMVDIAENYLFINFNIDNFNYKSDQKININGFNLTHPFEYEYDKELVNKNELIQFPYDENSIHELIGFTGKLILPLKLEYRNKWLELEILYNLLKDKLSGGYLEIIEEGIITKNENKFNEIKQVLMTVKNAEKSEDKSGFKILTLELKDKFEKLKFKLSLEKSKIKKMYKNDVKLIEKFIENEDKYEFVNEKIDKILEDLRIKNYIF